MAGIQLELFLSRLGVPFCRRATSLNGSVSIQETGERTELDTLILRGWGMVDCFYKDDVDFSYVL